MVRGKGGCGLVVGRGGKIYFTLPVQTLLGGTSRWDDRPPKRGKIGEGTLGACHRKRERAFKATAESSATADRNKTNLSLSGEGEPCAEGGRQACPDQTKAVRG